MKKVGLALSGGSAYGYAHIGVLEVLEENNIPVNIIAGTSMGALLGGIYASGVSIQDMHKRLANFSKIKMVDVNPLFLSHGGLIIGNKVTQILKNMAGNKTLEECKIPFKAIATDIATGEKYVFEKGDLVQAIRASISVPGMFKPVKIEDKVLVDGGLSDNMPVEEVRKMGADVVIGVDVCTYYKKQNNLKTMIDIVISASNIMVSNLVKAKKDKGDICIKIEQPNVSFNGFSYKDALKSIEFGRKYALEMLPEIKRLVEN